jgi:hypothetical protein
VNGGAQSQSQPGICELPTAISARGASFTDCLADASGSNSYLEGTVAGAVWRLQIFDYGMLVPARMLEMEPD